MQHLCSRPLRESFISEAGDYISSPGIIDRALIESEYGLLQPLTSLALLLPGLAVAARRLHDLNQSAWWLLLYVFILGAFFWKGTTGPNRFGPDPLGAA